MPYYEKHVFDDSTKPFFFSEQELGPVGNVYPTHWHESVELLYIKSGRVTVISGTERITGNPGELLVIGSNRFHTIYSVDDAPATYMCVIMSYDFCVSMKLCVERFKLIRIESDERIRSCFDRLKRENDRAQAFREPAMIAVLLELFVYLLRKYLPESPPVWHADARSLETVNRAVSFICDNLSRNITLDDICREVNLSKYYFSHLFRRVTGQTVIDYLNFQRCIMAHRLLTSGKYSLSECADRCGFGNAAYFSAVYKKYMGSPPSDVRNNRSLSGNDNRSAASSDTGKHSSYDAETGNTNHYTSDSYRCNAAYVTSNLEHYRNEDITAKTIPYEQMVNNCAGLIVHEAPVKHNVPANADDKKKR